MKQQHLHTDPATELPKHLPFQVPAAYFEHSVTDFLSAAVAANAATDHLLGDPCQDLPFACPDGYFDSSHLSFIEGIRASDIIINATEKQWPDVLPFAVPDGYFDDFSAQVIAKIQHSDEDLVDDTYLQLLDKAPVQEIPAGYFEQANFAKVAMQPNTTDEPEAKDNMVPLQPLQPVVRRFRFNNYAAAATVALIFGIGGYMMLGGNTASPSASIDQQLAGIPKDQISKYIQNNINDFDLNLLEASVSKSGNNPTSKSILETVDKEDIQAYLESEGI